MRNVYEMAMEIHSSMSKVMEMVDSFALVDWDGDDDARGVMEEVGSMADAIKELADEFTESNFLHLRGKYQSMSLSDLAVEINRQKRNLEKASKAKSFLQKEYDHLVISVVPDMMEDQNVETLKVPNVGRLQTTSDIYCSCKAAKREELQKWLKEYGHEALISKVVNASTLKAFVKEQMKKGNEYPGEILDITPYSKATVVKA